jgi:hypothetical protein
MRSSRWRRHGNGNAIFQRRNIKGLYDIGYRAAAHFMGSESWLLVF